MTKKFQDSRTQLNPLNCSQFFFWYKWEYCLIIIKTYIENLQLLFQILEMEFGLKKIEKLKISSFSEKPTISAVGKNKLRMHYIIEIIACTS